MTLPPIPAARFMAAATEAHTVVSVSRSAAVAANCSIEAARGLLMGVQQDAVAGLIEDGEQDLRHLGDGLVAQRGKDQRAGSRQRAFAKGFRQVRTQRPCSRRIVCDVQQQGGTAGKPLDLKPSRPAGLSDASLNSRPA